MSFPSKSLRMGRLVDVMSEKSTYSTMGSVGVALVSALLLVIPVFVGLAFAFDSLSDAGTVSDVLRSMESIEYRLTFEAQNSAPLSVVGPPADRLRLRDLILEEGWSIEQINIISRDVTGLLGFQSQFPHLMVLLLLAQSLSFFAVAGVLIRKRSLRRLVPAPQGGRLRAAWMGIASAAMALGAGFVIEVVQRKLGVPVSEQPWVEAAVTGKPGMVALFVALAVMFVPIAEEMFFRGYVFSVLAIRIHIGVAYFVSAWVFAAVHLNPSGVAAYFVYGVALAWAFHRTGRLVASIVGHCIINAVALAPAIGGFS